MGHYTASMKRVRGIARTMEERMDEHVDGLKARLDCLERRVLELEHLVAELRGDAERREDYEREQRESRECD